MRNGRQLLLCAVTGLVAGNIAELPCAHAGTAASAATTGPVTNGALYYRVTPDTTTNQTRTVNGDGSGDAAAPSTLPFLEQGISWSPDGTQSAYFTPTGISVSSDDTFTHVTSVQTSGNGVSVSQPRWVDQTHVAFLRSDQDPANPSAPPTYSIWTAKADGTGAAKLAIPATLAPDSGSTFDVLKNGDYVFRATAGGATEIDTWHPGGAVTKLVGVSTVGSVVAAPDGHHVTITEGDPANPAAGEKLENVDLATKAVTPIATGLAAEFAPVWSPDGTKISYSLLDALATATGGAEATTHLVIRDVASGTVIAVRPATTAANTQSWPMGWRPVPAAAPSPSGAAQVDRVAGEDRIGTAIQTSQLAFNDHGTAGGRQAQAAVLSRSDTFADALAGGALAAHKHGPLLLTSTGTLDPGVARELKRVLAPHATVYLLGGDSALSPAVSKAVAGLGFTPVRVAGPDRDSTAVEIAKRITANPHVFLVATGLNFPDALAAGAAAGAQPDAVVLLSDDNVLPAATRAYLAANHHSGDTLLGVGNQGSNALQTAYATMDITSQLRGHDRFETAARLAGFFYSGTNAPKTVGVATAANWPDALGGGALLGAHPGPLLLSDATGLPTVETGYLTANAAGVQEMVVFGGVKVVPQAAEDAIATAAKGAGEFVEYVNRQAPALP